MSKLIFDFVCFLRSYRSCTSECANDRYYFRGNLSDFVKVSMLHNVRILSLVGNNLNRSRSTFIDNRSKNFSWQGSKNSSM